MKTYKVTRTETIQTENVFSAENEEQAIDMFEHEKGENPLIISTNTKVEELKKEKENV